MSDGLQTVAAPWGSGDTVLVWSPADASAGVSFGAAVEQFRTAVPRFESSVTVSTIGSDTSLRASSCNLLLFPQAREEDVVSAMKEVRWPAPAHLCSCYCCARAGWRQHSRARYRGGTLTSHASISKLRPTHTVSAPPPSSSTSSSVRCSQPAAVQSRSPDAHGNTVNASTRRVCIAAGEMDAISAEETVQNVRHTKNHQAHASTAHTHTSSLRWLTMGIVCVDR